MGLDTRIYVKTSDGKEPVLIETLPECCKIIGIDERLELNNIVTHEVDNPWRYYSPTYERGPWDRISLVLTALHGSPNVEKVFYFSDACDFDCGTEPFTLDMLKEYSDHFKINGCD